MMMVIDIITSQWSKEENLKFIEASKLYGAKNYDKIAAHIGSRTPKQGNSIDLLVINVI